MKDHQFNLFTLQQVKPVGKVPISEARIREAQAHLLKGNGRACADILRDVRYKLEAFERRITIKPKP